MNNQNHKEATQSFPLLKQHSSGGVSRNGDAAQSYLGQNLGGPVNFSFIVTE